MTVIEEIHDLDINESLRFSEYLVHDVFGGNAPLKEFLDAESCIFYRAFGYVNVKRVGPSSLAVQRERKFARAVAAAGSVA